MKFIEEIVVEEFLPTVRSMLAESLQDHGLTQHEIAASIGVSQSAVSKYVHGDVERNHTILTDDRVQGTVNELADGLADGSLDPTAALIELEVLIRSLEAPGELLATMHEHAVPGLGERGEQFRVHDPDSRIRQRERVRSSVKRAVLRIEDTPGFVQLLPQVGSNVVEIVPDGNGIDDVAGIPGRIIDVEGRVAVPGDPRFGVSGHLAGMLLAARAGGSTWRAAINIRYSESLVDSLRARDFDVSSFPGDADVADAITERLRERPETTVVAQTGGFGIEPIIYLFGPDAPEVVELACEFVDDEF